MQQRILYITISAVLMLINPAVFACKVSPMGGSALALKAVVDHLATDSKQRDREIKTIKKIEFQNLSWVYVVETVGEGKCQALGYEVSIEPNCATKVHALKKLFACDVQK